MFIKKIKLKNFKSFGEEEIELHDFNVLVGANASGKSNFVEALRFLKNIVDHGLENAISLAGGLGFIMNLNKNATGSFKVDVNYNIDSKSGYSPNNDDLFAPKECAYSIEIKQNKNNQNIKLYEYIYITYIKKWNNFEFGLEIIRKENSISLEYKFLEKKDEKLKSIEKPFSTYLSKRLSEVSEFHNVSLLDVLEDNRFTSLFHDILDISIFDFDIKKAKSSNKNFSLIDLEENGENIAVVLKNLFSHKEDKNKLEVILSDILPFINKIEVKKSLDNSLITNLYDKYLEKELPSFLFSDGTISVVLLILALFFENNKLSIFEEPEKGLHPSLIALIMDYFYEASKEKQIIITTHNPEIVKHTKIEDLLLVSRDENGFSKITRPAEKEMVNAFLANDLGLGYLFVQNLLDN